MHPPTYTPATPFQPGTQQYGPDTPTLSDQIKWQNDLQLVLSNTAHLNAACEGENIIPGTPVYMDQNGIYRPTTGSLVAPGGTLFLPTAAMPFGLCMTKRSNTLGDIAFSGIVTLSTDQLQAVLSAGQLPQQGALYLSPNPTDVGKLTFQPTPDATIIGACVGPVIVDSLSRQAYRIFVCPQWRASADVYAPQRLMLNGANYRAALPADQLVVPNCQYVYDLVSDAAVAAALLSADLENCSYLLEGNEADTSSASPFIVVRNDGVYWMDPDNNPGDSLNVPQNHPRHELWIGRPRAGNSAPCVSSLVSDGTIKITNPSGQPASKGALIIGVNLTQSVVASTVEGKAFKSLGAPGGTSLQLGDSVDSIVNLTPDTLQIAGGVAATTPNGRCGKLSLAVIIPTTQVEAPVDYVRLNQTDPRVFNNAIDYLGMGPNGSVVGRFRVPALQVSKTYNLKLLTQILCKEAGVPPNGGLSLKAFVIPPASVISTIAMAGSAPLPDSLPIAWGSPITINWLPVSMPVSGTYTFEVDLSGIQGLGLGAVAPGSTIYFMLARPASDSLGNRTFDIMAQWFRQSVST